ncbi:murein DD-endopeptidase MepM/ murein hydrolase activator NlpD [Methylobacterium sp. BE186]|uniref:peptidoglycan DD-metalloendopeptidase family protein n=1 Tax=Methylobacterium sp. BE186 TaxID=2817715 RepID=UPI00285C7A9D|nr:peptidoglycan DD-metalloendopeptidase family protein [Methylobacterium sp. BE186]MDR7040125.1 murein DD-endopeptidase MepM/ murein hydrolase activator NlpD [Methylobacterium sp. BE186]
MKQSSTRIGRTSVGARRAAPRRPRRRVAALLIWPVLLWAGVASWFAYSGSEEAKRLAAEQVAQKAAYEDKVKALTRRLVGVASHQMLEQDGLAGRMADIVTRQVELENRVATLSAYAERVADPARGGAPAPTQEAAARPVEEAAPREPAPARGRPAAEPNVLRLGGPRAADTPPPAPNLAPRSVLEPRLDLEPPQGTDRDGRVRAILAQPTRVQFDALEASLTGAERRQGSILDGLARGVRGGIGALRAVLGSLGVALAVPAPAQPAGRPAALRDPFEDGVRNLEAAFDESRRWRSAADAVPLRRPIAAAERNLTSNFGLRKDPFTGAATMHAGMDFRAPVGTEVRAAAAGRVITAGVTGGYGNLIEIDHGNGVVTRYGHLSAYVASVGQVVQAESVVGLVGSTGRSTGPHLHYETRVHSAAVDPLRFLKAGAELFDRAHSAEIGSGAPPADETSED